jgi:hypothetical protein
MPTIEDLREQVVEGLNTAELQVLLHAGPFLVAESPPTYLVPTKEFSWWVIAMTLIASRHNIEESEFIEGLDAVLNQVTGSLSRLDPSLLWHRMMPQFSIDSMARELGERFYGGYSRMLDESLELQRTVEGSLVEKGLLLDPIDFALGPITLIVVGLFPYSVHVRTKEGNALVSRINAMFWDLTIRERKDRPKEIIANFRLLHALRAFGAKLGFGMKEALERAERERHRNTKQGTGPTMDEEE